jgi:hypothetical protein
VSFQKLKINAMKRLVLTLLGAFLFASVADAQSFSLGLKAGLNIANQDYESSGASLSPDSRTGFHAGVYGVYMFSEQFGLQPELMYNQAGSTWDAVDEEIDVEMDYLSLPIIFRYQPFEILNIHIGPQLSYCLKAEGDGEDFKDDAKDIEFAGVIGAGVEFPVGLGLSARYNLGLSDATDMRGVTIKNNIFQVSVSYRILTTK